MIRTIKIQIIAALLCLISLGGYAQKGEPFFFIQMTDTQFGFFTDNKGFEKKLSKALPVLKRKLPRRRNG